MKLCLQFCWNIENQESSSNTSELEHITEVVFDFFLIFVSYDYLDLFANLDCICKHFKNMMDLLILAFP